MTIYALPVAVSALTLGVFLYLAWVKPDGYLRAWAWLWLFLTLRHGVSWINAVHPSQFGEWLWLTLFFAAAGCLLWSARLLNHLPWHWTIHAAIVPIGGLWSAWAVAQHNRELGSVAAFLIVGAAALIFFRYGYRWWGQRLLAIALLGWAAVFLGLRHTQAPNLCILLGTAARSMLALCMSVVVFEEEKAKVEENLLGLSMLNLPALGSGRLGDTTGVLESLLDRLCNVLHVHQVVLWTGPLLAMRSQPLSRGFSAAFIEYFERRGGELLSGVLPKYGGVIVARDVRTASRLGNLATQTPFSELRHRLVAERSFGATALALQAKKQSLGVLLLSHSRRRGFMPGELRFLLALANQTAIALENLRLMGESMRRSGEFEILTHVGTAISSALDVDALLRLIHAELQKLIDVRNFYVAFVEESRREIRFELEIEDGVVLPKRQRPCRNALTEHVLATGRPLLINSDVAEYCRRENIALSGRNAKSWIGAPIVVYGKTVGIMAIQNYENEHAFDNAHLRILEIVAAQAAVSIENARLFSEEQRNTRRLEFLNHIGRIANSTLDSDFILGAVAQEIQKTFYYDHIGIGVISNKARDIEFRAEAGRLLTSNEGSIRRVPLGLGIVGTVARTGQMIEVEDITQAMDAIPVYPESRSVLAIPLISAGEIVGVLNLESSRPRGFQKEQVLVLRTLADQLAIALRNAMRFQEMQQQAITDGLTGLKTRRFFMESLESEWSRAKRSGRPFSVVLLDLDNFKQINDTCGHHAGDQVLERIARILEQRCRASNTVARYGGDEFTILLPETLAAQALTLCNRLAVWISTDPELEQYQVRASFGLACYPDHGSNPDEVLHAADVAMYQAKRAGGGGVASTADDLSLEHTREYLERIANSGLNESSFVTALPVLLALTSAIDNRDGLGPRHSVRVAEYACIIAEQLKLDDQDVEDIRIAGRLHDIGKSAFSSELLTKKNLSKQDWELLRKHPTNGAEMLAGLGGAEKVAAYIASHHEWFDGSGYPGGSRGEHIPLGGRILALAEAYDAMTTQRVYMPALTRSQAAAELRRVSGSQFDPLLVNLFLRALEREQPELHSLKSKA